VGVVLSTASLDAEVVNTSLQGLAVAALATVVGILLAMLSSVFHR
jgi:ABC-type Fe3+ transport system permease subunit